MQRSSIEWTDATWNPVTGCIEVSPGCAHCYAKTFAERFRGVPGHPYERGFDLQLRPERLDQPLRWKKAALDLRQLDERPVSRGCARRVHPRRLRGDGASRPAPLPGPHQARRAPRRTRGITPVARSRLDGRLGGEPALDIAGSITLREFPPPCGSSRASRCWGRLSWILTGSTGSSPVARAARGRGRCSRSGHAIRDQCIGTGVPFFFKQWGAHDASGKRVGKKRAGRILDGSTFDAVPDGAVR